MDLKIKPFKTDKNKIKLRPLMEKCTIPRFPQSVLLVGSSNSGKTTLLLNLMLNKDMYNGYFDFTILFSRTAHLDDSFKKLKIKNEHIFDEEKDMIQNMEEIVEAQKRNVENKGITNSPKILLIFEDATTNEKLLRNKTFKSLFTLGRHLNIMVIVMIHKYKSLPRVCRLNAMNIIFFRASADETDQLVDDFTPPGYSKKEFKQIVEWATTPDKDNAYNFLYMCNKLPFKEKFRKNFDTIITLEK